MNKIFERRSVREFKDQEVSLEDIKEMIKAGMQAPTARNQQPWEFVVMDQKEIHHLMPMSSGAKALREANKVVAFVMRKNVTNPEFLEQDMAGCLVSFMLQARDLGVGTIWIGTYPHEERLAFINQYLGLADNLTTFALVGLGYPKDANAFYFKEERYSDARVTIRK